MQTVTQQFFIFKFCVIFLINLMHCKYPVHCIFWVKHGILLRLAFILGSTDKIPKKFFKYFC